MPLLLFWAILRSTGGDGLHSLETIKIEKRSVFLFSAPHVSACGDLLSQCWLVFLLVGMVASTCGGFRVSFSVKVVPSSAGGFSPIQEPWCLATWSPWLLVSRAIASITFRLRAATAAAPVHHTLRQPCFSSRKLRLRGCRWCLRLLIMRRQSPLGRSPCSVSLFGLVSF